MKTIAVITGDIINSREIENKELLIKILNEIFHEIEEKFNFIYPFEIFRGDSMQAVLKNSKYALRVIYLLKSGLLSKSSEYQLYNIRIVAGIGKVDFLQKDVKISNGSAFELSGTELDNLKHLGKTISVMTESKKYNEMLSVMNTFAEVCIQKWSKLSAEVVFLSLMYNYKQQQIAQILEISQSAVQQRLSSANYEVLLNYIRFFENLNWK